MPRVWFEKGRRKSIAAMSYLHVKEGTQFQFSQDRKTGRKAEKTQNLHTRG